jgi:hypothetical protein
VTRVQDPFTAQFNDGHLPNNPPTTIHQYSTYLGVHEMIHNVAGGLLTRDQRHGTGAYLPLNDDDDNGNGVADLNEKTVLGEDDLVKIEIPAMQNAPAGGHYTLSFSNNLKVWEKPEKIAEVVNGVGLDPSKSWTFYVEGVGVGAGAVTLTYTSPDGKVATDFCNFTVFSWTGPGDVPGTSTYTYAADGGAPGDDSKWVGGGQGETMVGASGQLNGDPNIDIAKFKAARGPIIGKAGYQAAVGYVWDYEVNVVRVAISAPVDQNGIEQYEFLFAPRDSAPRDGGNMVINGEDSKTILGWPNNGAGIKWGAMVTLTGPDGGRGIDRIQTGFIQTVVGVAMRGTYANGAQRVSDIESKTPMNDSNPDIIPNPYPWYDVRSAARFTGTRDPIDPAYHAVDGTYGRIISSNDSPGAYVPLTLEKNHAVIQAGDTLLKHVDIHYLFQLDISSVTLDDTVNSEGSKIFTRFATTSWWFDGSGNIGAGPNYPWTSDGAEIYGIGSWEQITDGSLSPLPTNIADVEGGRQVFN